MSKKFKTAKPVITDAQIARIRAAAHRYLLAGGPVFLEPENTADDSRETHIANVRAEINPTAERELTETLDTLLPYGPDHPDTHDAHETMWGAVWQLAGASHDAGYLFGVCVGLELAALTFCQLATVPIVRTPRGRKGGRR